MPGCRGFSQVFITANVARMSTDTQQHNPGVPRATNPLCFPRLQPFWWVCAKDKRGAGSAGKGRREERAGVKFGPRRAEIFQTQGGCGTSRLHGNQRHMQPLLWQHMCAVYLEDPHCLLFFFLFKPIQSQTLAPAPCPPTTWSLSPKDRRRGFYQQFLTKRAQQCPFQTSSRSPPGLELSLPLNPARSNTTSGNYSRGCSALATTQLLAAA